MVIIDTGAVTPVGYLPCDGSAVSRTTYDQLFAVIGTTYEAGNGSTTFNIPNLKGRIPIGVDSSQTEFDELGETGGTKTHTLTEGEIPGHAHGFSDLRGSGTGAQSTGYSGIGTGTDNSSTPTAVQTDSVGGGQAHQNLQPYITLNYIIKT